MVGAVKGWQKSDPEKSRYIWTKLSETNSLLEKQLNKLSELAEEQGETYERVINRCSIYKSDKVNMIDTCMMAWHVQYRLICMSHCISSSYIVPGSSFFQINRTK